MLNDQVLFQDTFTEASNTTLGSHTPDVDVIGNGWVKSGYSGSNGSANSLQVSGANDNLIVETGGDTQGVLYAASISKTPDCYMKGVMSAGTSDDTHSFFLRLQDGNNYYVLRFSTSVLQLVKVVAATPTQLATGTAPSAGNTVRYEVQDGIHRVYVNNILRIKVSDTAITGLGIMCYGAGQLTSANDDLATQVLDNFECGDLEPALFHDGFIVGSTTELSLKTPNKGSSWSKVFGLLAGNETMNVSTSGWVTLGTGSTDDGALYKANKSGAWSGNQAVEVLMDDPDSSDDPSIIAVRITDEDNFYALRFNESTFRIYKKVGGSITALGSDIGSGQVFDGDYNRVRLEAEGNALRAYVDDVLLIDITDNDLSTGSPGIGIGSVVVDGDDMSTQSYYTFWAYELNTTQTVQAKASIFNQVQKSVTAKALIVPRTVTYTSIDDTGPHTLDVYEGDDFVCLIPRNTPTGVSWDAVKTIANANNAAATVLKNWTGRQPTFYNHDGVTGQGFHYNGKPIAAVVPTTCGAGCAYGQFTGLEILESFWEDYVVPAYVDDGMINNVFTYEMGRNYYHSEIHDRLEYVDDGVFQIGNMIARFFAFYALVEVGEEVAWNTDPDSVLRTQIEGMLDDYINDVDYDWSNTLLINTAYPNAYSLGASDLLCGMMMYLQDTYENFANTFFYHLLTRDVSITTQDSVDNWAYACCAAANEDLTSLIQDTWKIPISEAGEQAIQDYFNKTIQAKGHIWVPQKYIGVEDAVWDFRFRQYPDAYQPSSQQWTASYNNAPSTKQIDLTNGLRIRSAAGNYYAHFRSISGASNSRGTTLEAEVRRISGDSGDLQLIIQDGTKNAWLHINNGAVSLNGQSITTDTTGYIRWRLVLKDNHAWAYKNGVLIGSNDSATNTSSKYVFVGDWGFGSTLTEYYLKQMWYSTKGAFAPEYDSLPFGAVGMYARAKISKPFSDLKDNFNDNTPNTSLLTLYNFTEQNGRIEAVAEEEAEIVSRINNSVSPQYWRNDWSFENQSISFELQMDTPSVYYSAQIRLYSMVAGYNILYMVDNGILYAIDDDEQTLQSATHSNITHRFLRFRHSGEDNAIYFEYSSDSKNWSIFATYDSPSAGFTLRAMSFYVYVNDGTLSKTTILDNFNWGVGEPTITAKASIAYTPARTVTAKASITKAISSLYDNFNDNSFDTGKWSKSGAEVSETNGQIEMVGIEESIWTSAIYNLVDDSFFVKITPDTAHGDYNAYILFGDVSDNYRLLVYIDNGSILAYRHDISDSPYEDTVFSTTYNSTNHQWIRVRITGTTLYIEASANSRDWSTLGSFTPTTNFINSMKKAMLSLNHYDESGLTKKTIFDSFNTYLQQQTVTAKGSISFGTPRHILAKASIHKLTTRSLTSKATISRATVRAITAKASINKTISRTTTAKGRVERQFLKQIISKARISTINYQNITSKARIEQERLKNIQAKGDIHKFITRQITANALISQLMTQELSVKANIRATKAKTVTSKARIGVGPAFNIEAKASIQRQFGSSISAKSNIRGQHSVTTTSKANIIGKVTRTMTAGALIGSGVARRITAKANIRTTHSSTIGSKANLRATQSATTTSKANIVGQVTRTISAKAWLGQPGKIIQAKAYIDACIVDQQYLHYDYTGYFGTAARPKTGQIVTAGRSGTLCKVGLDLAKVGTPTDNAILEIWSVTSDLPDTKLAESSTVIAGGDLTAVFNNNFTNFEFSGDLIVTQGVKYALVLKRSGSNDDSNYFVAYSGYSDLYAGGNEINYNGSSWSNNSANDLYFIFYTTPTQHKTKEITAKGKIIYARTKSGLQARARIIPPASFVTEIESVIRQLSMTIEVKWDGITWTDESLYFLGARGNEQLEGDLGEGVASTLDVEIDNTNERFTPDNTSSPLYGYLKPRVPIRVSISIGGYAYRMFTGYIKNIHPDTRTRICSFECFDNQVKVYNKRANGIVYEDLFTDQLMLELAELAGLETIDYTLDAGDQLVNFGYFEDKNVWPLMGEIAVAERGRIFFDRYGHLVFWNRSRLHNRGSVQTLTLNDWILDLDYSVAEHEIKNQVIVKAAPRYSAGIQQVWSNGNAEYLDPYSDTLVYVPAYTAQNVFLELEDPCTTFIIPIPSTDYLANSAQDGSGDDLTTNIEITEFINYGNAVFMVVENKGNTGAYLTQFQLRGNPAKVLKWIKVTAKDQKSIDDYGAQEFELENNFITSEAAATSIADEELERRREAINLFRVDIIGIPYILTGDVVSVEYREGEYKDYMIDTLDWTYDEGGFKQRLTLTNPYSFPTVKSITARAFIIRGDRVAHVQAKARIA